MSTLFICLQCGSTQRGADNLKVPNPAALQLAADVSTLLADTPIKVELVRCLEQCDAPIAWALKDNTKHTFTFAPATTAEELAITARAYASSTAEKKLVKAQMPEAVRKTITSRTPPLK